MSTQLLNDAGEAVAVRFFGGKDRGPMVDVSMPRTVADIVAGMSVAEETSTDLRTTLSEWISDQKAAGATVRYVNDLGHGA